MQSEHDNEFIIRSPYDLEEIDTESLTHQNQKTVMQQLQNSYELFIGRKHTLSKFKRLEVLERTVEIIASRADVLARQAAEEGGKPLTDSIVEINRGIQGVKVAIHELWNLKGETIAMGTSVSSSDRLAMTIREPRGVVLAISAFNHPFNLIIHQVIPAIAVGCPVLVKPASQTPLSCRNIVNILYESGLPEEWCQMILCENVIAEAVVRDARLAFLTFIGSAKVGWYLRSILAPGAACVLEHGGVAPVIVEADVDLGKAIPLLVKGGYYHAGQVCVSVQRIFVNAMIEDAFISQFVDRVKALKVGSPLDLSTDVGPLISPAEVKRVHNWVAEAIESGGRLLCGGTALSKTCYAPTVILNPSQTCQLSQKEVFGPVVCVYTYTDRDEAIANANSLNFAFQAAVFTQDVDIALDTARKLKGLAVMINDHAAFRVDWMPFGGYEQSGLGVGGIGYSMKEMSIEKLVVIKSDGIV